MEHLFYRVKPFLGEGGGAEAYLQGEEGLDDRGDILKGGD
jgi:hypothetical protein